MNDRYDFGSFDPVEAEENATRERRLKQYSHEAIVTAASIEQVYVLFPEFGAVKTGAKMLAARGSTGARGAFGRGFGGFAGGLFDWE